MTLKELLHPVFGEAPENPKCEAHVLGVQWGHMESEFTGTFVTISGRADEDNFSYFKYCPYCGEKLPETFGRSK